MTPPNITDSTPEREIPDHVKGLKFIIDDKHSLMFNSYGSLDLCNKHKYGVEGRITIENAKKYGAALLAAVAAYEQTEAPVQVEVENWMLKQNLQSAESKLSEARRAVAELESTVELIKRQSHGKERSGSGPPQDAGREG